MGFTEPLRGVYLIPFSGQESICHRCFVNSRSSAVEGTAVSDKVLLPCLTRRSKIKKCEAEHCLERSRKL